ncbi:hypothetical protein HUJ04_008571 [Dendroctonus ponderosae]|nr:hypothetical protein HUJ04_008571 [Dendroctonus ponderosae]
MRDGLYSCSNCGKNYKLKKSLQRHFKFECGKNATFPCHYCDHISKRRDNLKKHILAIHVKKMLINEHSNVAV